MEPWVAITFKLIVLSGMLLGLIGLIVPVFPGITVIWVLALVHGLIFGFARFGGLLFAVITLLAVAGWTVDNVLITAMAREGGARWTSIGVALVAGFVGSLFLTPIGGIFTALGGLYLAEYLARKDKTAAWKATKGMALGWGWSFVARFSIGVVMIGVWAIWAWA